MEATAGLDSSDVPKGGFKFDLFARNERLQSAGLQFPKALKTGTTIAGLVFKDGVVLGADTRATEGDVVADKNCAKIHYLAPNMYCCGAGTAADTENVTELISSKLTLHRLSTKRQSLVCTALRLLKQHLSRYGGYIGAYLVLGGVDKTGPHLFTVHAHGSSDSLPYVTMGSGSLAAMSVFEDRFKPNMERAEAMQVVRDAIAAGIFNDLGSGSHVDLCVITADKVDYLRPYDIANKKGERAGDYRYKKGTTETLTVDVRKFDVVDEQVKATGEAMET